MKELIPKHHRHQLVHNFSASEINDGVCSVSSNTKFYHNVLIFFSEDTFLQTCMLLMKEMTIKYFKCNLDDETENRSNSVPIRLKGDSENSFCIDQTNLEHNLHV